MFGRKRALLKLTPPPPKGEQPKEQSYILEEGQRDGDIEVISIDENAGVVTVDDYGTVTTVKFEAPKASSSPPPSIPSPPNGGMAAPAARAGFGSPAGGGMRSIPQRTLRLPGLPAGTPGASMGGGMPGYGGAPNYAGAQRLWIAWFWSRVVTQPSANACAAASEP